MTTLLLNAGDPTWTIPGGGSVVNIFGSSGVDSLALSQGAQVIFDSSFNAGNDNLYLEGNSSDFMISRSGAAVSLADSSGSEIVIPAGLTGQTLVFADGSLELGIETGQVMIGSQAITSTNADLTATVNPAETSGSHFDGSGNGGVPGDYTIVSADQGIPDSPVFLDASSDGFKFTDDASVLGSVEISDFTDDDVIEISGSSAGDSDYSFANDGADVSITYNNVGTMNIITLMGVVSPSDLVYNEAGFEALMGFDAVTYA